MGKPVLLLVVSTLSALVVPSQAQCGQINDCQSCSLQFGAYKCLTCQDGYAINFNQTACCSAGCYQDMFGFAACYVNQTCVFDGCQSGFFGTKCTPCQSSVPKCDDCRALEGSPKIECGTCEKGYYRTTDGAQCCSNSGCDLCSGTNNEFCSACKPGWFLYQNSCDQCGTTCVSPPNGTARCDPVTGSCYYGCQPNYHGRRCQRLCTLANCNTCIYNETSDNLTCAVCVAGRYGPCCTPCRSNCLNDTGDIRNHNECGHINNCISGFLQSGDYKCIVCQDGYTINAGQTTCCSVGCFSDSNGFAACYVNQTCVYEGCQTGYLGPKCTSCQSSIPKCESCRAISGSLKIECTTCSRGYYRTTDATQCCSNSGCDSCTGTNNEFCSACKPGWFLYQNSCDQCGTTCVSPPNGTARCDPVTGSCYYGCQPNYHGRKCQRLCTLANCNTCTYNESSDNLTCSVCVPGRYGPYCTPCNSTCLDGCKPGYRGDKCDVACDAESGLANCAQCNRYEFTCTVCKPGFWDSRCQFTCGVNCVPVGGASGPRYCNISDGKCRDGCMPTHFKHDCSGSCPNCAYDVCDRSTGTCLDPICDSGFYGETCNQYCPVNCGLDPNGLAYCNFTSGDCTYGCRDGFYGAKCTLGCSQFCKRSPANTEKGPLCNQATENCLYACEPGFYTPTCGAICRSTCVDKTCDINSGTCAECDKGANAGILCPTGTVSSSTDSNNPDTHNDSTPSLAAAVGGSVGGFAAGVALVIVIIVLRRRYRVTCPCQRREESGHQSDNSDTYARINANAISQEGHMYAGLHANRNSEYDVVEPGHFETNMNQLHQEAYVRLDSCLRNQEIYNSLTTPQPQPNSEPKSVDSKL